MSSIVATAVALILAAIVVAMAARRLRLPYTVGLVAAGGALALITPSPGAFLSHDLIFLVLLPPLLFEAGLNIHWPELRRDLGLVLALATVGVIVSAAVTALGMAQLAGWPLPAAVIFGVLIAATDPVAVIAMFKDNAVGGRIRLLVESESLFNDGTAAVFFAVALPWAEGRPTSPAAAAQLLAVTVGGGLASGLLCGSLGLALARRTADHLLESALTAVVAYGSFLLAEGLHGSGVLAAVAAGLVMGNLGVVRDHPWQAISARGREFLGDLWEFAAFLANSLIFLLMGLSLAALPFAWRDMTGIAIAVAVTLTARLAGVYPLSFVFGRSAQAVSAPERRVLWWGGLRGALALALVLALPEAFPARRAIVLTTFAVAAFSIVVQGLTMPALLRRSGFLPKKQGSQ